MPRAAPLCIRSSRRSLARDAIGNHALVAQRLLRSMGFDSHIYAASAPRRLRHLVRAVESLPGGADAWALYQCSTGSADRRRCSPIGTGPLLVDYHNITPARLFEAVGTARRASSSRGTSASSSGSAQRAVLGIADSAFNQAELDRIGLPGDRGRADPRRRRTPSTREVDRRALDALDRADARGATGCSSGGVAPNKAQHDLVKAFARRTAGATTRTRGCRSSGRRRRRATRRRSASSSKRSASRDAVDDHGRGQRRRAGRALPGGRRVTCASSSTRASACPLLEAMHHRVPIVAYRAVGGARDPRARRALPARQGHRPRLPTAVHRVVLTDPALRAQLVAAGRALASRLRPRAHERDASRGDRRRRGRSRRESDPPVRPDARARRGRRTTRSRRSACCRGRGHESRDLHRRRRTRRWSDARRVTRSTTRWPADVARATTSRSARCVADLCWLATRAARRQPPQPHAGASSTGGTRRSLHTASRGAAAQLPRSPTRCRARHRRLGVQRAELDASRLSPAPPSCRSSSTSTSFDPRSTSRARRLQRREGRRRQRLAVRRPDRAEQVPARHRQGVRRVPAVPRPERPAAPRRRRRVRARMRARCGASSQRSASTTRVDDHRRRLAPERSPRTTGAADVFVVLSASTRASACRCSRRCTTACRSSRSAHRGARDARRRRRCCSTQGSVHRRRRGRSGAHRLRASRATRRRRRAPRCTTSRSRALGPLPRGDGSAVLS